MLAHHFYYPQPNIFKFPKTLEKRESDAKRLGCGLMLTEFDMGAHMPNADLQGLLEVADNYLHSWVG